uniref:Uncharacterized protein n=1 Tax=Arundo donax TaxID=35708 RepID=A0A0A9CJP0_ARUDO
MILAYLSFITHFQIISFFYFYFHITVRTVYWR